MAECVAGVLAWHEKHERAHRLLSGSGYRICERLEAALEGSERAVPRSVSRPSCEA
jgi:hypothetical protein